MTCANPITSKDYKEIIERFKKPKGYTPVTGILETILWAKENGSEWADCALAELCLLTERNYEFRRIVAIGECKWEIEVKP